MTNQNDLVQQLLGEEFMQQALAELGLQNSTPENQVTLMAFLGENILKRISLEILSVLPEEARDEYVSLVGGGDAKAMVEFLQKYVNDPEGLMREYAEQEYEATKTTIHDLRQGVE